MEFKVLKEEKSILKVNWFFLITMIWSILSQFIPTPANFYQYIAFLIPISIYLFLNRDDAERIVKPDMLNFSSIVIIFLIWLGVLPLIFLLVEIYVKLFGSALPDMVAQDAHDSLYINFFFVAVTPAILEEILLRGIILDGYRHKSRFVAALANGLLFGMLHLNFFQFFHTFVAGFLASYLVFATNSIFAGIFMHMVNNGLPLIINYLYPIDPNMEIVEQTNFLSLTIFAILGIVMVFRLIRLLFKVNNTPLKEDREISKERVFNLPLIFSILIFAGFSVLILFII